MLKGQTYRIYPTDEQERKLRMFIGCARSMYNKCLGWYRDAYREWKENGTEIGHVPLVTAFKKEYEYFGECDNAAIAAARANFERALKDFFKSRKGERKGRRLGFPQFKKKGKCKDAYRTCDAHGTIRFNESDEIRLPKVGWVRCVRHRVVDGEIKGVTVEMRRSGRFYISVTYEVPDPVIVRKTPRGPSEMAVAGLDMSLGRFLVSSDEADDTITKYRRLYREEERRMAVLQRRMHRKMMTEDGNGHGRRSANREKARLRYARLCERTANRRKDFIIKTALHFARKYDAVVIEDLDMQAMARSLNLGKSVMDLGWGKFRHWLEWECRKHGALLVKADRWFPSSKTCGHCGAVYSGLKLSDREWVCPVCGCVIDRDRNAAENLRRWFFEHIDEIYSTDGTSGIQACGEPASASRTTAECAVPMKQEPSAGDPEAPSFREG